MNLDEAMHTFIAEARELLQEMEQALLRIEHSPNDSDTVNAIFRAAHTIKGSAGLFGLDDIVAFTHVAESVLDKVRNFELTVDAELVALLLGAGDHISELVAAAANGGELDSQVRDRGQSLVDRLGAYLNSEKPNPNAPVPAVENNAYTTEGGGEVQTDLWHISLRFSADLLRSGMDPLSFIRYLGTLGKLNHVVTLTDSIPGAGQMDPETCYLGFEISLESGADKVAIEGAFDFIREDSEIRILPPRSKMADYLRLIRELPEEPMLLGEILVRCGTLTPAELEAALRQQQSGEARPIGEVLLREQMVQAPVMEAALEKQKQAKQSRGSDANLIRVDADKLDRLINLVGELIIAGAAANLIANRAGLPDLQEATLTLSRLVEEVRDSALDLRMVQIGATFNRFGRVVRDVSRELGKEIDLVISGADTELDKTVVEKIGDPLTHLVRNSMDHGIEPLELRLARGKPASGTLRLNAYHDSGSIVIEVSDDGGGLNKAKILAKATERGLVPPDANLSDQEIYNLIFEAGFSTADAVSNLSGRGVGMDVVRRNIQALRGTIELDSKEGLGSTTRIRLPLTLAIIDGFLVGVGHANYVIPLDMVVECIELADDKKSADSGYLNLRGEVLPYVKLRDMFEVDGLAPSRQNVVVVQYAGTRAGLVVDTLQGEFQTVIKPLGKMFGSVPGIGGFTILGSGEVALILDVQRLVQQVAAVEGERCHGTKAMAGAQPMLAIL